MSVEAWTIAEQAVAEHGALQKPAELAAFLDVLIADQPAVVVEIGADAGGTLWAWQQIAGRVIGVDLHEGKFSTCRALATDAEVCAGDSHDPGTAEKLQVMLADRPLDVLFIDGDHTYDGVRLDYTMYAPMVRDGGIVAFHDICHHPQPNVNVDLFWAGFAASVKNEIITDPLWWGGIGWFRRTTERGPGD